MTFYYTCLTVAHGHGLGATLFYSATVASIFGAARLCVACS